ncbi:hypothetical protein EIN_311950 [Entamoeba invadens IP1]|uniref:Uncharacterized protein n=1 Tax=Entamoeba invadens IP1 TaxID=370355 RepID=A0A0A1TUV3_ENTIV|nr:hypothetical protein EIN_311950 [Entamoeba invadens IP1]ELP83924.1 hypothetical protein EIN_311950 [Entamoeba invadens IP1]|eukprot:XP_004183270.1 hypothetical protein EIN_311950 [Entamoeba invadens IP1]
MAQVPPIQSKVYKQLFPPLPSRPVQAPRRAMSGSECSVLCFGTSFNSMQKLTEPLLPTNPSTSSSDSSILFSYSKNSRKAHFLCVHPPPHRPPLPAIPPPLPPKTYAEKHL